MEKKLLRDASNWTLQQDDEVRQLLEDFTNSVSNTGARLNLDAEQLKERVLSTDCDIQQLNIQLALLKNAKFVENTVEEEDSRPKPILPTVAFSKDEMIRIVVDSVKSTLKDVTAQLYWEREPLGIESLPTFNDEAFSFYSLGSSKPPSQVLQSTKIKADIVSLQETPPEVPTIPEMVPPAPNISFPVQNGFGDYSSEESEPEVQTSRVQTIPKPSSMDGLKQLAPVIPKPQARGLFSSDDEDENEKEQLITTSVQPVAPIVKSSQDLMQQLASKLKSRDSGATEAPKTVVVEAAEQERAPVLVKEEATVVKKEEPRPVAVQRRMVLPAAAEATSSTKVTSSVTVIKQEKKEEQPVQQKRIQEQVAPKTVVTRKESVKKRGLFSDSDSSEEEFMAPVKPATVKPVVKPVQELKKVEPAKTIARKATPTVRKSIFDSDSSDEEITGFFKKSATVKNKATASSSLLHKRSVSPVKVASQPEPLEKTTPAVTEKISASDSSSPLKHETSAVVLVKSENQPISTYPLAAEEELVLPSASIPTSNTSVPVASAPATVPVNTTLPTPTPKEVSTEPSTPVSVAKTGPKAREKSPSPVRSLSPPRSVAKTEELKKDEPLVREKSPPAVQSLPTTVRVAKTEESVDVQLSVSTALPPELRLPSPLEEPPKYDPKAQPLTCESRSPSADVPPIHETRSVTPPEEAPDHLEQDKLPPLPTADPLTDSPLEEEMPVGKAPGKLNNANFAAMLGRQLSAGPPGSRPKTASTPSTERPDPMNSASAASMSASPTTDSPGGLCHLTKSRPRRPNVHKPTIAKVDDLKTVVDPLASATNGDSDLKISSPSSASKQSSTPIAVKKPELTKVLNGSSSVATSKAEVKPAVRVIASVKSATTTSTTAKKGLFDFSSSDEELSSSSKITKAAATLKTSVTSGSPSLTLKPKSTPAPLPGTAASKSMPRNANLAKYKNMFDQEDDLDVSLFKKDKT